MAGNSDAEEKASDFLSATTAATKAITLKNFSDSRFLRIALELRLMIYAELLISIQDELPTMIFEPGLRRSTPLYTRFLLCCRTVYLEAWDIIVSQVPLLTADIMRPRFSSLPANVQKIPWKACIRPNIHSSITVVMMCWESQPSSEFRNRIRMLPQVCPQLSIVMIFPDDDLDFQNRGRLHALQMKQIAYDAHPDNGALPHKGWIVPKTPLATLWFENGDVVCISMAAMIAGFPRGFEFSPYWQYLELRNQIKSEILLPQWASQTFKIVAVVSKNPLKNLDFLKCGLD